MDAKILSALFTQDESGVYTLVTQVNGLTNFSFSSASLPEGLLASADSLLGNNQVMRIDFSIQNSPIAAPVPTPTPTPAPVPTPSPPTPEPNPPHSVSPDGSTVTRWSSEGLTDKAGNVWLLNGPGTSVGAGVTLNNVYCDQGADLLTIFGGLIWAQHTAGDWFTLVAPGTATPQGTGPTSSEPTPTPAPAPPSPTPSPPPVPSPVPSPSPVSTTFPTKGIAQFSITAPVTGNTPFTLGFPLVQGDFPGGISVPDAQAVVKAKWPDGSARFAVVSGVTSCTANMDKSFLLKSGTTEDVALTTDDLKKLSLVAKVDTPVGTVTWTNEDLGAPWQTWITGPKMSCWYYRKPVANDPALVAFIEVKLYSSGDIEVLPWVENGYIRVAGQTSKTGEFVFTLGGTERFRKTLDFSYRARTPLIDGAALSYWLGTDKTVQIQHDVDYFQSTKMVSGYAANTPDSALVQLPSTYSPFQLGSYTQRMGDPGYQPPIGIIPEWDVFYLTGNSKKAFPGILRNAFSAGQWAIHYRDENTNLPMAFSAFPNLSNNASTKLDYPASGAGSAANSWDIPHHPSVGYMAYLLTGSMYHLETLQFAATYNYMYQVDNLRQFSKGIFLSGSGASTVRGAAWAIRTLAQVTAITPPDHPLYPEFKASFEANVDFNYNTYIVQQSHPFGFVKPYADYSGPNDGIFLESPWQQDFYTAAFGYALSLAPSVSNLPHLKTFFEWKAKSIIGRLGGVGDTEWLYRDAAPYTIAVTLVDVADWDTGTGPWPSTWKQMYNATYTTSPGPQEAGGLRGGNWPYATSYWGNLQPAISYAVEHGVPGALEAYTQMTSAPNWKEIYTAGGMDSSPVWAVAPRSLSQAATPVPVPTPSPTPPPSPSPAPSPSPVPTPVDTTLPDWVPQPGQTANVSLNDLSSVNPCPTNDCWYSQASKQSAPWRNWAGAVFASGFSKYGAMLYWGGGHGGSDDVSMYAADYTTRKWIRIGPDNPNFDYTPLLDKGFADYKLDDNNYIVPAVHTYNYPIYLPPGISGVGPKGSWLLPEIVISPPDSSAPHAVDLETGYWSRFSTTVPTRLAQSPYAGSLYDTKRNRVWWAGTEGNDIRMLDFNESHPRTVHNYSGAGWHSYYSSYVYVPEADMALSLCAYYGEKLVRPAVYGLSTGQPVNLPTQGFPTITTKYGSGFAFDWAPDKKKFYLYEGHGDTVVHVLTPSSLDFSTCTWSYSQEEFKNPAWDANDALGQGVQPMTRWRYNSSLQCFMWSGGPGARDLCVDGQIHDGHMQLWRPNSSVVSLPPSPSPTSSPSPTPSPSPVPAPAPSPTPTPTPIPSPSPAGVLPDWVPQPGTYANISKNTLSEAVPAGYPTQESQGPFALWSGGIYAFDFSNLGAYFVHGSGHLPSGAMLWAGCWGFDLDILKWVGRNVPASPLLEGVTNFNPYGESTDPANLGHTYPPHTYDGLGYISKANGGGPAGTMLRTFYAGASMAGSQSLHTFDLSSLTAPAARVMDNLPMGGNTGNYPATAVDEARGGVWALSANGNGPLKFVKFSDWSVISYPGVEINVNSSVNLLYIPAPYDMIVTMGAGGPYIPEHDYTVYYSKIVNGVPQGFQPIAYTGTHPSDPRSGGCWSTILNQIVVYEAGGATSVRKLMLPPAGHETESWTWVSETLVGVGGIAPSQCQGATNGAWSRFIEVPKARCFIWCDGINQPVQAWRLLGM